MCEVSCCASQKTNTFQPGKDSFYHNSNFNHSKKKSQIFLTCCATLPPCGMPQHTPPPTTIPAPTTTRLGHSPMPPTTPPPLQPAVADDIHEPTSPTGTSSPSSSYLSSIAANKRPLKDNWHPTYHRKTYCSSRELFPNMFCKQWLMA
jgi:hypothetical protein